MWKNTTERETGGKKWISVLTHTHVYNTRRKMNRQTAQCVHRLTNKTEFPSDARYTTWVIKQGHPRLSLAITLKAARAEDVKLWADRLTLLLARGQENCRARVSSAGQELGWREVWAPFPTPEMHLTAHSLFHFLSSSTKLSLIPPSDTWLSHESSSHWGGKNQELCYFGWAGAI